MFKMITGEILIYNVAYYLSVPSIIQLTLCTKSLYTLSSSTLLWNNLAELHLKYAPYTGKENFAYYYGIKYNIHIRAREKMHHYTEDAFEEYIATLTKEELNSPFVINTMLDIPFHSREYVSLDKLSVQHYTIDMQCKLVKRIHLKDVIELFTTVPITVREDRRFYVACIQRYPTYDPDKSPYTQLPQIMRDVFASRFTADDNVSAIVAQKDPMFVRTLIESGELN